MQAVPKTGPFFPWKQNPKEDSGLSWWVLGTPPPGKEGELEEERRRKCSLPMVCQSDAKGMPFQNHLPESGGTTGQEQLDQGDKPFGIPGAMASNG